MNKRFVLDRRTMLRGLLGGAAVALALPPLEAMLSSDGTRLASGAPLPRRFVTWFFGNGVRLDRFVPQKQGPGYDLPEELAPLKNVQDYCCVLSGFDNKAGYGRRGHHDGIAGCFSGYPFIALDPGNANYSSKFGGPSIDQVVASKIGSQTYLASLELGVSKRVTDVEGPTLQYLSHKGPDQPAPPIYNPQLVWAKLFNNYTPPEDPSGPLRVSMIDVVKGDAARLKSRVGKADSARIDAHLDGLRGLEKQIQALPPACSIPLKPTETNADLPDGNEALQTVSNVMSDLLVQAFTCDQTRVASFLQSGSVGGTIYWMTGATSEEHGLTHDDAQQELVHKAVVFNVQCFAYLLEKLKATPEGQGNLLDNCCLFFGSDCAEGLSHSTFDQPIIVAGRGGGDLKPGLHYRSPNKENTSDILLTCLKTVVPEATEVGGDQGYSNTPFGGIHV